MALRQSMKSLYEYKKQHGFLDVKVRTSIEKKLTMHEMVSSTVESFKYLGVQVDAELSLNEHITNVENKLSNFPIIFHRLVRVMTINQFIRAYKL